MAQAVINIAAATTTTLVSARVGETIKVYKLVLFIAGANNLTWQDSDSTSIFPIMAFGAAGSMVLDEQGEAWMACGIGTGLQLITSTSQQVSGRLYYTQAVV